MMPMTERALHALGLRHEHDDRPSGHLADATATADATRLGGLTQIWQRQIGAAMEHGTASVDDLTQNFAGIERQLAQALALTEQASGRMQGQDGMSGAVDSAKARLGHVMVRIHSAVEANHAMLDTVTEAVNAVRELNETAQSVERISQMTTLLSINARIEAARAGEAGLGFSVVADEVRRLAAQSRQDSQAIMQRVERIEQVVQQVVDSAQAQRARDEELIGRSRQDVDEILAELGGSMQQVLEASGGLCEIGQQTRASVAMALVSFQYQDRVSQRLGHVRDNLGAVDRALAIGWPSQAEVADLEAALMASYTMPEEGRTHRNEPEPEAGDGGLMLF